MEHPSTKIAPCPIYFGAHGGKFDDLGRALKETDVDEYAPVLCPISFDCGHCEYLHEWIRAWVARGYSIGWECDRCLRRSEKYDKANNIERLLPGFYQAGRRPDLPADDPDYDPDKPGLTGCTHVHAVDADDVEPPKRAGEICGWESSFLQLVMRRRTDVR